jgi:hypothetical protein
VVSKTRASIRTYTVNPEDKIEKAILYSPTVKDVSEKGAMKT